MILQDCVLYLDLNLEMQHGTHMYHFSTELVLVPVMGHEQSGSRLGTGTLTAENGGIRYCLPNPLTHFHSEMLCCFCTFIVLRVSKLLVLLQNKLLYIMSKDVYCVMEREEKRRERAETCWINVLMCRWKGGKKWNDVSGQIHTLPPRRVCVEDLWWYVLQRWVRSAPSAFKLPSTINEKHTLTQSLTNH